MYKHFFTGHDRHVSTIAQEPFTHQEMRFLYWYHTDHLNSEPDHLANIKLIATVGYDYEAANSQITT